MCGFFFIPCFFRFIFPLFFFYPLIFSVSLEFFPHYFHSAFAEFATISTPGYSIYHQDSTLSIIFITLFSSLQSRQTTGKGKGGGKLMVNVLRGRGGQVQQNKKCNHQIKSFSYICNSGSLFLQSSSSLFFVSFHSVFHYEYMIYSQHETIYFSF